MVSETYLNTLDTVAQTSAIFRQKSVETLYELGKTIEGKNRALRDIYHLFKGDWDREPTWRFTEITTLIPADNNFRPDKISEKNWGKLLAEIDDAKRVTYNNFDALKNSSPSFNDSQQYIDWYWLYHPYLVLELPKNKKGWKTARERLDWFLDLAPSDQGCPRQALEDTGIGYISDWYTAQE
jgi:hypothetical protein